MRFTIVQVQTFVRAWKSLKLNDGDLQALESMLLKNPNCGEVMSGAGGIRKVRFAPPSMRSGKSGATRVVYLVLLDADALYLITIFGKSDKANLSAADRNVFRAMVERIKESSRKGNKP